MWWNSFSAPFVLDDHESITGNSSLRDFWSLHWLVPPSHGGETVSGRPVLNLSFALNYEAGGTDVRGYRIANIGIHLFSGLILFGLVRQTLVLRNLEGWTADHGAFLALAVAASWMLHPLQTSAVTYVVQRAESLAGLFYLLTLYCFVRSIENPVTAGRWAWASVTACFLGIGTKEIMATAPVVVLLYDRAFISGSVRQAWNAHRRLYLGYMTAGLVLVGLVMANHGRGGSAGFDSAINPWTYLLTQCGAIVHYLGLVFWPASQVFDYGVTTVANWGEVLPQIVLLGAMGVGVAWALWRNQALGFLGACFFLLLAPSSSVVPVATQTVAEHRMYLPLAIPLLLVWLVLTRVLLRARWLAMGLLLVTVVALGITTFFRNRVYRSEITLWEDTVAKCPGNPRAHNNLGLALMAAGQKERAVTEYQQALVLQPGHAFAHFNLATILLTEQQWEQAAGHLRLALAADPNYISARVNLGQALAELGRIDEAIAEDEAALVLDANAQDARTNLAALLIGRGRVDEAVALLRQVLAAEPDLPEAHYHLGRALEKNEKIADAENAFQAAIRLRPAWSDAYLALGNIRLKQSDLPDAERCYRKARELDSKSAKANYVLGNFYAQQQKIHEAMQAYRITLEIDPSHVEAMNNLGNCQLVSGQFADAISTYEQVLRLRPDEPVVRQNLKLARELLLKR